MNEVSFQQARMTRDPRFDGRFFVAVKSTGIFCRNICPARLPKEENVEYIELAASALNAGYRPCLRCRPDSAPQSYAWLGVETTLVRAMKLLQQHPELSNTEIAEKLGISDGYLRRLFREKMGISPKQYQLAEQLLFAKKLLHETNFNVEQVAHSCGFGSSRRLQQNMKQSFGLTPSDIRKSKKNSQNNIRIELQYRSPYSWQHARQFWKRRAIEGTELVDDFSYSRTFTFNNCTGFFRAEFVESERKFNVEIRISDIKQLRLVIANIRRVLDLDADSEVIQDALLKAGVNQSQLVNGIRLPGIWDLFEAGCRAILGQQVSVTAALKNVSILTENLGVEVSDFLSDDTQSEFKRFFPTPEAVANSSLDFLKMPVSRKLALKSFAKHMCETNGQQDLNSWLEIKGVGPWTVDYAKLRGTSEPDIWLGGDLVVKKQIENYAIDIEKAAPWRSYLTLQLWSQA